MTAEKLAYNFYGPVCNLSYDQSKLIIEGIS